MTNPNTYPAAVSPSLLNVLEEREALLIECDQLRENVRKLDAAMEATLAATAQLSESTDKVSELEFHLQLNQREACEERMWRHDNHAKAQEKEKHLRLKLRRAGRMVAVLKQNQKCMMLEKYDMQRIQMETRDQLAESERTIAKMKADHERACQRARINHITASTALQTIEELSNALSKVRMYALQALADE